MGVRQVFARKNLHQVRDGENGKGEVATMKPRELPDFTESEKSKFWSCVDTSGGEKSCWEWMGVKWARKNGVGRYGLFARHGRSFSTHRLAWLFSKGPIPDGLLVCHHCDNPPCCNPAHLFLGTQKDNIADRNRKGRQPVNPFSLKRGENHEKTTLTEAQVREMRHLYQPWKMSCSKLAKMFGMTKDGVHSIIARRTWKHVV